MAVIGSMALAIRAQTEKLKGDLRPALDAIKEWGEAAKAAGADAKEVDRAMGRMRAEAMRGGEAGKNAGRSMAESLGNARKVAASLTGALGVVGGEMSGVAGHAIRLGSSLTQAFLAGGPVALGVTAMTAGFAALAGAAADSAKEIARARKEAEDFARAGQDRIAQDQEATQRIRDEMREKRGMEQAGFAEEQATRRRQKKRLDELAAAIAEERRKITDWQREKADLEALPTELRNAESGEISKRDEWIASAKKHLEVNEALLASARDLAKAENESVNLGRTKAEADRKAKESADAVKVVSDEIADVGKEILRGVEAWAEAQDKVSERVEQTRLKTLGAAEAAREAGERSAAKTEAAKEKAARAEEDRLRRLEIKDKAAADKAAAANAKISKMVSEQMQADHTALGLAQEKAGVEEKITQEKQRQTAAARELADITKRFANFGGAAGGMFGFGKGQMGFGWSQGRGDMPRRGTRTGPASSKESPFDTKPLEQTAANVQQATKAMQALPPMFERVAQATKEMGAAAGAAADRMAKTTTAVVGEVAAKVRTLQQRVDRFDSELRRAGSVGVGE